MTVNQLQEKVDSVSDLTHKAKCDPLSVPYEVVIVMASFLICTVYAGTLSIPGLYLQYFLDTFEAGKVITTTMISLQGSLAYLSCVAVGPLIVRFGARRVAAAGSMSATVGIFLSGFAFNIIWLYVFYGVFTGFGIGMLMISIGVSVQEHTNKRRALAGTISLCGAGLGTLIMPQIVEYAIAQYGERGSLLILGGMMLNTLPCTLLLRPRTVTNNNLGSKSQSTVSPKTSTSTVSPSDVDNMLDEKASINLRDKTTLSPVETIVQPMAANTILIKHGDGASTRSQNLINKAQNVTCSWQSSTEGIMGLGTCNKIDANMDAHSPTTRINPIHTVHTVGPAMDIISDDSSNTKKILTSKKYWMRKTLREIMTPVSLADGSSEFTISMALVIGAYFFWIGGFFSAFVFSPAKALSIGLTVSDGATLLTLTGIGDVSGRIATVFLSPCHDRMPVIICIVTLMFTSVSCTLVGVCRTYTEMMVALMIYGISNGMASVVHTTAYRDLIGVRHFALILSYASVVGGIGNLLCTQLMAYIWEKTGDISIPFSITGGLLAAAGLLILAAFIVKVKTHENLKNAIPSGQGTEAETKF